MNSHQLAPFAAHDALSRGRRYQEPKPEYRTEYQRDRDRVIHSTAFRRLVYKTQVFVNHEGDLYRTRLTHSLEVTQIARTIARALYLNETLVEAIALSHDLGHTPFGHANNKKKTTIERTTGNTRNCSSPSVIKINSKMHLMPKPNNTASAFRSPAEKSSPKWVTNHKDI